MAFIGRRKLGSQFHVLPLNHPSKNMAHPECNGVCHAHLERRVSQHGPYFKCTRCSANIPENEDGEPALPVGICSRCHAYVYPTIGKTGKIWNACSQYWRHKK